jgi:hypothetical protein
MRHHTLLARIAGLFLLGLLAATTLSIHAGPPPVSPDPSRADLAAEARRCRQILKTSIIDFYLPACLASVRRLMQVAHFFLCFCAKVPLKIVRQTSTQVKKYGDSQEKGTHLHGGMRCVWLARRNGWTACPSPRCT